jgi:hypothetical protein
MIEAVAQTGFGITGLCGLAVGIAMVSGSPPHVAHGGFYVGGYAAFGYLIFYTSTLSCRSP